MMSAVNSCACEVCDPAYQPKKKVTRRQRFLGEMEQVMPWEALLEVLRPAYPTGAGGRPPYPLEKMLRVYFLQQWFGLSDPGLEDALYDSESLRAFAGFVLGRDSLPDESTILGFRHWLERHGLGAKMFEVVGTWLTEQGLLLRKGTIVDATIIQAPSSTKNRRGNAESVANVANVANATSQVKKAKGARDPEMSSTRKNNCWYFGMKAHVGGDSEYGLVHTLHTTTAKVHDSQAMEELLHGEEKEIYGNKAYANSKRQQQYQSQGVRWRVTHKAGRGQTLSEHQKLTNRRRSRVRALGEHAFGLVKNTWGHRKVRYRGLKKNTEQLYSLFALANVTMARYLVCDEAGEPILQAP